MQTHTHNGHIAHRLERVAENDERGGTCSTLAMADSVAQGESDLLQQIVGTSVGPLSRLGETINLTLDQVSEWIAKPENRRHIFNLLGLLDAQTQLLIAQQRVMAAAQLARLAADETAGPETVRRACKDLLSLRLIERSRPPAREARGGDDLAPLPLPKPPLTEADLLNAIRRFEGKDAYATPGANPNMRAR